MASNEPRSCRPALSAVTGVLALGAFSLKALEGPANSRTKEVGDLAFLAVRGASEVAAMDATSMGERPRLSGAPATSSGKSLLMEGCSTLAGAAALAVAAASARAAVRRRAEAGSIVKDSGSVVTDSEEVVPFWKTYWRMNQTGVVPKAEKLVVTEEQKEAWLQKKVEAISKLVPMSKEEFDDQVDESTYQWARNHIPFLYKYENREQLAFHKRTTLLRQRALFEKLRLFKPLIMNYPTAMRRGLQNLGTQEDRKMKLVPEFWMQEERVAGFTYEDFVREQSGQGEVFWKPPEVGETVKGIVMGFCKEGAFIEIGAKTWAFASLANVSLVPILSASEVLTVGQEVEARILSLEGRSLVNGDPLAKQIVVSMTELERELAWDEIMDLMRGKGEPVLEVMVRSVRPFGAEVLTKRGLVGVIRNANMGGKALDTSLVGLNIPVKIVSAQREKAVVPNPNRVDDYAIEFDYNQTSTMALSREFEAGQVATCKIKNITPIALEVDVNGTTVQIKKVDIIDKNRPAELLDVFEIGETIKAVVVSKEEKVGALRLGIRALERRPGDLLVDKAGMFAAAEETAAKWIKASKAVIDEKFNVVAAALENNDVDAMEDLAPKKRKRVDIDDESTDPF